MADRKTWEEQVQNLKTGQAPESLLARITTVVPNLKQETAEETAAPGSWLVRFMSDWQYGLAVKIAAFACVAVLGVMAGSTGGAEQDLLGSLIFGDIGWESVI